MVLRRLVPGAAIPPVNELKEIESMLAERVGEWTKTWKEQGIEEGRKEGHKEGLRGGEIVILERLLTRRFGPLPEAIQMRLRSATTEQLEYWADQVLDAASIEDVFDK